MTTNSLGDFLRPKAVTSLNGRYLAAGVQLRITTNFELILKVARKTFQEVQPTRDTTQQIRLRLWVEDSPQLRATRSKPYFRGVDYLVFAGFDSRNSLLINLRDHCGAGRFTSEVASDEGFWEGLLFPALLTILGPSAGLVPLQCACVAWRGSGLLLAGEPGAGKSVLSSALAQSGFDFLSADRTLIGEHQGRLLAWGLSSETKQHSDSAVQSPFLSYIRQNHKPSREDMLHFNPIRIPGISHVRCCEPRWLIFLEPQSRPAFSLTHMAEDEAAQRLISQLYRETAEVRERQCHVVEDLVIRECYRLKYGGDPNTIADVLRSLVLDGWKIEKPLIRTSLRKHLQSGDIPDDPLRRFCETPLSCDMHLMGRTIRLETENPVILNHAGKVLHCLPCADSRPLQFQWKIVTEPTQEAAASWPAMTVFSDNDLRYMSLGQHCFIAVDLRSRQAVGVVPENLANDDAGFSSVFLAGMFYLTAPALGLVTLSAACVSMEGRGLLLFGIPGSGKTTASYHSTRSGLEFHADQAVFLESKAGTLRAWGDFWPATFREDATDFLPELTYRSRPLVFSGAKSLCVGKNSSDPAMARSVVPVGCIFLQRWPGTSPKLVPLCQEDVSDRLAAFIPFLGNEGSDPECDRILKLLDWLPAYDLAYGDDSSEAAVFFRSILSTHHPMENPS